MSSVWKFWPRKETVLLEVSAVKLILFFIVLLVPVLPELQNQPIHSIAFPVECRIQLVQPPPDAEYPVILQPMENDSPGFTTIRAGWFNSMQLPPGNIHLKKHCHWLKWVMHIVTKPLKMNLDWLYFKVIIKQCYVVLMLILTEHSG